MADEQVMPLSDAVNELSKMKGVFRAIERLDEVLQAAQRVEGQNKELETERVRLVDSVSGLRKDYDNLLVQMDAKKKASADFEAELVGKKPAALKTFNTAMEKINAQYSKMTVAAKEKMGEEIKAKQKEIDDLDAKLSDMKRDARVLEAEIEHKTAEKAGL